MWNRNDPLMQDEVTLWRHISVRRYAQHSCSNQCFSSSEAYTCAVPREIVDVKRSLLCVVLQTPLSSRCLHHSALATCMQYCGAWGGVCRWLRCKHSDSAWHSATWEAFSRCRAGCRTRSHATSTSRCCSRRCLKSRCCLFLSSPSSSMQQMTLFFCSTLADPCMQLVELVHCNEVGEHPACI
jgi:hypothetical protein